MNSALNVEYLMAQFYSHAAAGAGLRPEFLTGLGAPGAASGARQAALKDQVTARHVAEIAADKRDLLAALRRALGARAAAQPAIDLSPAAFARAAGRPGLDPYADQAQFLAGAHLLEKAGLAAYRRALPALKSEDYREVVTTVVADRTYHEGLIRTAHHRSGMTQPAGPAIDDVIDAEAIHRLAAADSLRPFFPSGLNAVRVAA